MGNKYIELYGLAIFTNHSFSQHTLQFNICYLYYVIIISELFSNLIATWASICFWNWQMQEEFGHALKSTNAAQPFRCSRDLNLQIRALLTLFLAWHKNFMPFVHFAVYLIFMYFDFISYIALQRMQLKCCLYMQWLQFPESCLDILYHASTLLHCKLCMVWKKCNALSQNLLLSSTYRSVPSFCA